MPSPGAHDHLGRAQGHPATGERSLAIATAMRLINRRGFLPAPELWLADCDQPIPIGSGQTNSQPSTVAAMLDLLDVPAGARVLDVGSGSGWTTAILAHLVGSGGSVLGVERVPGLVEWGSANLAAAGMPWAQIRQAASGVLGAPIDGGYDRILVSAAAAPLPAPLVAQIGVGGRMVIPVQTTLLLVERLGESLTNDVRITEHGGYLFVPLLD